MAPDEESVKDLFLSGFFYCHCYIVSNVLFICQFDGMHIEAMVIKLKAVGYFISERHGSTLVRG